MKATVGQKRPLASVRHAPHNRQGDTLNLFLVSGFEVMRLLKTLLVAAGMALGGSTHAAEPQVVVDAGKSAEWIAKALLSSGYKADFSVESLKEVDRFFDDQAPNGRPKANGLLAQDPGTRIFSLGSYVGEVLRRHAGGTWRGNDSDPQAEIDIELVLPNGSVLWPVQRVMKRFQQGSEESVFVYGTAVAKS